MSRRIAYVACHAWLLQHGMAAEDLDDIGMSNCVDRIAAAAGEGDRTAIRLAMDFLIADPRLFAGRGAKSRLAYRLRGHVDRVATDQAHALADHWLGLFKREVVPQEGPRVARLLGALVDDVIRERALEVPIVLPWVDRCVRRIVPDARERLWLRAPHEIRDGDRSRWRACWSRDDHVQLGRAIFESVPIAERRAWASRLIDVAVHAAGITGFDDHPSWERGRLLPRSHTWPLAVASFATDIARGWNRDPIGGWRLAPLVWRACEGRSKAFAEACWQALAG